MILLSFFCFLFFFKQKTAYEMRISDWSSDVCSSDLIEGTPDKLYECNCSHCTRKGYLMWFIPRGQLRLKTPASAMSTYRFHKRVIDHHFRSEEHTSELQSLMRISYAVFCLKKNIQTNLLTDNH